MSRIDRVRILLVSIGMYGRKYLAEATEKDVGGDVAGIVDIAQGLEEKYPVILEKQIPLTNVADANHSLEPGNEMKDIQNLQMIMEETRRFIG